MVPDTFILDGRYLARMRQLTQDGQEVEGLARLYREAEAALKLEPLSVTSKTSLPASRNPHDYYSQGPYWWPDPEKPDGLPYIRRDGETNPECNLENSDHRALERMTFAVITLSQAWYFSGRSSYAEQAVLLLRTWFFDEATRMNPHMQYAQAIPGITDGRGIGIIDTAVWVRLVDALQILQLAPGWTHEDHCRIQQWFREYVHWMKNSANGLEEEKASNNHGTWFDAQVIAFALFTEQKELACRQIEQFSCRRIASQIAQDGSQPHELQRTMSWTYSTYNLHGLMSIARLAERVGLDIWNFGANDSGSIHQALEFLRPYTNLIESWPYPEFKKETWQANTGSNMPLTVLVFGKLRFLQPIMYEGAVADCYMTCQRQLFSAPFYISYRG